MTVLVDFSNIAKAAIMGAMYTEGVSASMENVRIIRHLVFNSIGNINSRFHKEYGPMVIAVDGRKCWRYEKFPAYKGNRKKDQKEDDHFDWEFIGRTVRLLAKEAAESTPYKVVQVDRAEADDVIGVLARKLATGTLDSGDPFSNTKAEKVLIVGSDNDYFQLHDNPNIEQFCWRSDKFIGPATDDRTKSLEILTEKILRGETSDGIPSIRNPDNCLVEGIKQRPVVASLVEPTLKYLKESGIDTMVEFMRDMDEINLNKLADAEEKLYKRHQKKLDKGEEGADEWLKAELDKLVPEVSYASNWLRNRTLIDFKMIPKDVETEIETVYNNAQVATKMELMQYFAKHECKILLENMMKF